jgi:LysR family transcriptional regulator, benzoate and cis,cis-muconate-responsive activator of ben and cat genes
MTVQPAGAWRPATLNRRQSPTRVGGRPTAVLTCPQHAIGTHRRIQPHRTDTPDMDPVRLEQSPLAATAGLAWNGDLPRQLQQVLFDTADRITF